MTTTETLIYLYQVTYRTFNRNLDGISHEESLLSPHGGSSMNWIAGHLLLVRGEILEKIGAVPEFSLEQMKIYDRYTPGIAENPVELSRIMGLFSRTQEQLLAALSLGERSPEVFKFVAFYSFHESYHCGQLGIMRRALGKQGAI